MKNVKLRPANGGAKAFVELLQMKPSELSRFNHLPKSLWRMMSNGQKKIYLYHKRKRRLATNVSEFRDIRLDMSNYKIKTL